MNRKLLMIGVLVAALPVAAFADHVSVGVGVGVGPAWGYPYYPPPAYVVEAPPPVMLEEPPMGPPAQAAYSWYYCPASRAYYPYVQACPSGWQTVPARPARP